MASLVRSCAAAQHRAEGLGAPPFSDAVCVRARWGTYLLQGTRLAGHSEGVAPPGLLAAGA